MEKTSYIPALRFKGLTPVYDLVLKWIMREETFKKRLISQSGFNGEYRVLDLGCGTGTLTILVKQLYPQVDLIGLDGDSQVLDIARSKANSRNISIQWDLGMAYDLPFEDNSFDRVLSSLMIHHLTTENKRLAFKEVFRVLKPNGEFHLADFGTPHNPLMNFVTLYMSKLEETADNFRGHLPSMMREAGFPIIEEREHFSTAFGPLTLYSARKPSP